MPFQDRNMRPYDPIIVMMAATQVAPSPHKGEEQAQPVR